MISGTNPTLVFAVGYAGSSLLSYEYSDTLLQAIDVFWSKGP